MVLSQSGRSWVKVDGHSTRSGGSLGINLSIKVIGPNQLKTILKVFDSMPSKSERCNIESNWILFDPKAFLCSTLAFDIKLFVSVLVNFPDFQHASSPIFNLGSPGGKF